MKVITRSNKIYIHYVNKDKKLIRFSTKMQANKSNIRFVNNNIEKLIKDYEANNNLVKISFNDYVLKFLEREKIGKKEVTYCSLKNNCKRYIMPFFAKKYLHDVNRKLIKDFLYELELKDISAVYKKIIKNILKRICLEAIDNELIQNFNFPIFNPKDNKVSRSIQEKVIDLKEIKRLLASCDDDFLKQVLALKIFTGIRNGELIALKWSDIDFKNEKIRIENSVSKGKITSTKTKKVRVIDMLPPAKIALQNLLERHYRSDTFVVVGKNKKGKHYKYSSCLANMFKTFLEKNNFKMLNFYWTRHIFATMCLSKGIPVDWISKTLGHSKINTTFNYYATYIENKEKINTIKQEFLTL